MPVYYPPVGFHFRVEFDLPGASDNDMRFREVGGLSVELEEETYNEGGENRFVQKLPVRGALSRPRAQARAPDQLGRAAVVPGGDPEPGHPARHGLGDAC